MSFDINAMDEAQPRVVGELCIFNANELKQKLLSLANGDDVRTLDLSEVSEVDTAGVQLLLMAKREASRHGGSLRYVNHSEPALEAIRLLGLGVELDDPSPPPSAGSAQ